MSRYLVLAAVWLAAAAWVPAQDRAAQRSGHPGGEILVGCLQEKDDQILLIHGDEAIRLLGNEDRLEDHVGETVKITGRRGADDITVATIETVRGSCDSPRAAVRDRDEDEDRKSDRELTADDQGGSKADRETTAKIRRALVEDDSLSTLAKNVKVITRKGQVTLRGPVESEQEKAAVQAKAESVLGDADINNRLIVKPDRARPSDAPQRQRPSKDEPK